MLKMVGFLSSSFFKGSIWKEALKSLLYFIILFIVLLYPCCRIIAYFAGDMIEKTYGTIVYEVVFISAGLLLSLVASYLVIMFGRDSYYYGLVRSELEIDKSEPVGMMNQVKSFIRVIFLLIATIVGILVSFIFPISGMILMSFCFALEIMSYIFDLEKVGIVGSFKFVFSNFLSVFILGSFCFFLSLIPGLGLVSYPASLRAGALYFKEQKEIK